MKPYSALGAVLALVVAGIILASCDARSVSIKTDPSNLTYSRDKRTDMCFASLGRASGDNLTDIADSFSMTYVPCTLEVMALVPISQGGQLK